MTDLEQARDRYERAEVAHNRALKAAEVARNWCNDLALIVAKAEEEYLELLYAQAEPLKNGEQCPKCKVIQGVFGIYCKCTTEPEIITLNHDKQGDY